jgi:hypothetical protein
VGTPQGLWPTLDATPGASATAGPVREPGRAGRLATALPIAIGGALVMLWLLTAGSGWSSGILPSTMTQLARDTQDHAVVAYFVTDQLEDRHGFFSTASPAGLGPVDDTGTGTNPAGDPNGTTTTPSSGPDGIPPAAQLRGGIVVWKTFGGQWQAAASGYPIDSGIGSANVPASAESRSAAQALDAAGVRRLVWSDEVGGLPWAPGLLGFVTLLFVVFGPTPRTGTRWFWFWVMQAPLGVGMLAYAVDERIGLGARMDRPLAQRRRGPLGVALLIGGGLLYGALVSWFRSRGWAWPL